MWKGYFGAVGRAYEAGKVGPGRQETAGDLPTLSLGRGDGEDWKKRPLKEVEVNIRIMVSAKTPEKAAI